MKVMNRAEKYAESVLSTINGNVDIRTLLINAYNEGINDIVNNSEIDSISYQDVLNEEQIALENGIYDDEYIIKMTKETIDEQTIKFLKLRDNRKK